MLGRIIAGAGVARFRHYDPGADLPASAARVRRFDVAGALRGFRVSSTGRLRHRLTLPAVGPVARDDNGRAERWRERRCILVCSLVLPGGGRPGQALLATDDPVWRWCHRHAGATVAGVAVMMLVHCCCRRRWPAASGGTCQPHLDAASASIRREPALAATTGLTILVALAVVVRRLIRRRWGCRAGDGAAGAGPLDRPAMLTLGSGRASCSVAVGTAPSGDVRGVPVPRGGAVARQAAVPQWCRGTGPFGRQNNWQRLVSLLGGLNQ